MKTQPLHLLALALLLALLLLACNTGKADKCGEIWLSCPDLDQDTSVCSSCYLLSEEVRGSIRYYRFHDCADDENVQSSVSADCSLEQK